MIRDFLEIEVIRIPVDARLPNATRPKQVKKDGKMFGQKMNKKGKNWLPGRRWCPGSGCRSRHPFS
jgi:hypothetical protein